MENACNELEVYKDIFAKALESEDRKIILANEHFSQGFSTGNDLKEALSILETLHIRVGKSTYPSSLNEWLKTLRKGVEELKSRLEKLDNLIAGLKEAFKVINMVPSNPKDIMLHFDDENTPEAPLKAAIFDKDMSGTVTALARGMGGVGKICALRGCGQHPDVSVRFPGGVLYMSLGSESSKK